MGARRVAAAAAAVACVLAGSLTATSGASAADPSFTVRPSVNQLYVLDGTPAQAAGLSAGDVLVALDGLRVDAQEFDRMLAAYSPGDRIRLHAFRRDELMEFGVELAPRVADTWPLRPKADADIATLARRKAWLRQ